MTEAEAKRILERLLSDNVLVGDERKAVTTAILALKMRIPKKPIYNNTCPTCSSIVVIGVEKHCPVCGQRIAEV